MKLRVGSDFFSRTSNKDMTCLLSDKCGSSLSPGDVAIFVQMLEDVILRMKEAGQFKDKLVSPMNKNIEYYISGRKSLILGHDSVVTVECFLNQGPGEFLWSLSAEFFQSIRLPFVWFNIFPQIAQKLPAITMEFGNENYNLYEVEDRIINKYFGFLQDIEKRSKENNKHIWMFNKLEASQLEANPLWLFE